MKKDYTDIIYDYTTTYEDSLNVVEGHIYDKVYWNSENIVNTDV